MTPTTRTARRTLGPTTSAPRIFRRARSANRRTRELGGRLLATADGGREHTVDELRRGLGAEHLREFHGLVDHDPGRRIAGDAKLVERDPQHVAVDTRHL